MIDTIAGLRSLMFAPGNQEPKLCDGLASHADAAIVNFEDAVAPADTDASRRTRVTVLADEIVQTPGFVRTNSPETGWVENDLAALAETLPRRADAAQGDALRARRTRPAANGYSAEVEVERLYRDSILMTIGEDTSDDMRTVIAKSLNSGKGGAPGDPAHLVVLPGQPHRSAGQGP